MLVFDKRSNLDDVDAVDRLEMYLNTISFEYTYASGWNDADWKDYIGVERLILSVWINDNDVERQLTFHESIRCLNTIARNRNTAEYRQAVDTLERRYSARKSGDFTRKSDSVIDEIFAGE